MNIEQGLNHVADRYRAQGYDVVVRPGSDALPPFAKDFKVEILATRPDGNVLASVKGDPLELEADPNLSMYAEVIEKQRGWRFDVSVLGCGPQWRPGKRNVKEPEADEVHRSLDEAERLLRAGSVTPSLIVAWAALESAMRHRLRVQGSETGWGTSPRTILNELYSSGVLSNSIFRDLEGLLELRNIVVHGFAAPDIEPSAVQRLIDTARRLMDESRLLKQTA